MVLVVSVVVAVVVVLAVVGLLYLRKAKRNHGGAAPPEPVMRSDSDVSPGRFDARYEETRSWYDEVPLHGGEPEPDEKPRRRDAARREGGSRRARKLETVQHPVAETGTERVSLAKVGDGTVQAAEAVDSASQEHDRQRAERAEVRRQQLLDRMLIEYVDEKHLRRDKQLGSGGQGMVFGLVSDVTKVAKYWDKPLDRGLGEFEELIHRKKDVEDTIAGYPIHLCWPESPVRKGEQLAGYTMARIGSRFYFSMTFGSATKSNARELQHAIPRRSQYNPYPFEVDDQHRLELVNLVAVFLDGMHRNDVVYGDFSWMNFVFSLDPVELCVLDFDASRVLGSLPFTRSLPLDSPDWEDPQWPDSAVTRMDSDRYKFALFAYRMLVARSLDALIDPDTAAEWSRDFGSRWLGDLWIRALGPAGSRPSLSQWVSALESGARQSRE